MHAAVSRASRPGPRGRQQQQAWRCASGWFVPAGQQVEQVPVVQQVQCTGGAVPALNITVAQAPVAGKASKAMQKVVASGDRPKRVATPRVRTPVHDNKLHTPWQAPPGSQLAFGLSQQQETGNLTCLCPPCLPAAMALIVSRVTGFESAVAAAAAAAAAASSCSAAIASSTRKRGMLVRAQHCCRTSSCRRDKVGSKGSDIGR